MSDDKSQGERLMDLFVYAPAGLAQSAAEEIEKLAEKGRHRVEGQLHTARLLGQFAVQTARREAEKALHAALNRLISAGAGSGRGSESGTGPRETEEQASRVYTNGPLHSVSEASRSNGSELADLAIPGYDSLSASQVVQRLAGLSGDELEEVKDHELANRHRRTILNRVEQLLAGSEQSASGDAL